jgi:hypothetical protein
MFQVQLLTAWVTAQYVALAGRFLHPRGAQEDVADRLDDRGDVPGWVMVTVMTAALVVAILGVFRERITDAIVVALDSVTGKVGG